MAAKSPVRNPKILAFGDSLTAGYQLAPSQAYPARLEKMLNEKGFESAKVVNAGVSGDTSAQALGRVDWVMKQGPFGFVLLCIGSNDGLRMAPLKTTEKNIRELIQKFRAKGARVVLLGMKLPTNFDPNYRAQFERMYREIARSEKTDFLPFLLDGVATDQMLNLEDQMHPNAKGYEIVARNVLGVLAPLLPR